VEVKVKVDQVKEFELINSKLDKIDLKLDNHLERIAKVEERTESNSGWVKILFSALITLVVGMVGILVKFLKG
jgi:hypothetical protein